MTTPPAPARPEAPARPAPLPLRTGRTRTATPAQQTTLTLEPLPTAPRCARATLRETLTRWGLPHLTDTAQAITTELITNASAPRGALSYPWLSQEELEGGSWA